jgi:hypothetical protein
MKSGWRCEIWGYHGGEYQYCGLLRYDAIVRSSVHGTNVSVRFSASIFRVEEPENHSLETSCVCEQIAEEGWSNIKLEKVK